MATLEACLEALADTIREAVDGGEFKFQVEPILLWSPSPPTVDMFPSDTSNDPQFAAFGEELGGELVTVRARVGTPDDEAAQRLLLAIMDDEDPLSITPAILDDPTLGGVASDVSIFSRSGFLPFNVPELGTYLGCTWQIVLLKAKS